MNPFYLLIPNNKIALSDKETSITYSELIRDANKIKNWLIDQGYGSGHRIGIAGSNSVRTYTYILAAQMLSSAIGLNKNKKKNDWDYKIEAANINVIIDLGKNNKAPLVYHRHYDKSTLCPKEYAVYFSSGTTSSQWGKPQVTPMVWEIDENNWGMGIDIVNYNRSVINPCYRESDENIQIQPMGSWIGFGQESTTLNLIKHGHTVLIEDLSEWDAAVEKWKPTWTVMFPLVALKLIKNNKGSQHSIKCVEMSGAKITKKQVDSFKNFFNCNYLVSHYGTSQSGNSFHSYGDGSNLEHIGKPCEGFVHAFGEDFVRIGKNNTLEIKWPASPPHLLNDEGYYDTCDVVKIRPDGNWEFLGRSHEMLIIRGGSKFQAPSIEDRLLEHGKIEEVYIYPIPESDIEKNFPEKIDISRKEINEGYLYQLPGCLFYGDITIEELQKYCREVLPPYQVPVQFFKLKDKVVNFTKDNIWKVRRLSMHDDLKEKRNEWCIEYKL